MEIRARGHSTIREVHSLMLRKVIKEKRENFVTVVFSAKNNIGKALCEFSYDGTYTNGRYYISILEPLPFRLIKVIFDYKKYLIPIAYTFLGSCKALNIKKGTIKCSWSLLYTAEHLYIINEMVKKEVKNFKKLNNKTKTKDTI